MRLAPTAANRQPFLFLVVENPKEKLSGIIRQRWVVEAPIVIIAFGNREECWKREWDSQFFHFVDTAIALDHLVLVATSEGLGTCWVAANDPEKIRTALNIPEPFEFIVLTPLGVPAEQPPPKPRKGLKEIIKYV